MSFTFSKKYAAPFVSDAEIESYREKISAAHRMLHDGTGVGNDRLGWIDLPVNYDKDEFVRIKDAAKRIQAHSDVLIVIGIGGSYLGARAVIEGIKSVHYNELRKDTPAIYFSGNSISPSALCDLIAICEGKDFSVNVISKSGTTTEPAIAFRVFRDMLIKKYGEAGAAERIFVTTDREKGTLKQLADAQGYETYVVPDDVGGRYSVLTAVGLLPIAAAGIDIDALMGGAARARADFMNDDLSANVCYQYAAVRNVLYEKGKKAGAIGGKLLGAGGGGFLLFYVEKDKQEAVRAAMSELLYIPFRFETGGSRVIHFTPETYEPDDSRQDG